MDGTDLQMRKCSLEGSCWPFKTVSYTSTSAHANEFAAPKHAAGQGAGQWGLPGLHAEAISQSLGKMLANTMKYAFFDTDSMLDKTLDMPVSSIFKDYGEDYFRDCESQEPVGEDVDQALTSVYCKALARFEIEVTLVQKASLQVRPSGEASHQVGPPQLHIARPFALGVLKQLAPYKNLVVATGGGAVIRPLNWGYMHSAYADGTQECGFKLEMSRAWNKFESQSMWKGGWK
eukprot:1160867-Pelagomonas_calceolata.AAC.5